MPSILRASLVAAVLASATACSGGAPGTGAGPVIGAASPSAPTGSTVAPTPTPPPATSGSEDRAGNADVLAFTAPTLDGGTFEAAAYAGQDVILWLWAPW